MKPYLVRLTEAASSLQARSLTREYLQARILGCLQRAGAMVPLAFHGGTALRFLFLAILHGPSPILPCSTTHWARPRGLALC